MLWIFSGVVGLIIIAYTVLLVGPKGGGHHERGQKAEKNLQSAP